MALRVTIQTDQFTPALYEALTGLPTGLQFSIEVIGNLDPAVFTALAAAPEPAPIESTWERPAFTTNTEPMLPFDETESEPEPEPAPKPKASKKKKAEPIFIEPEPEPEPEPDYPALRREAMQTLLATADRFGNGPVVEILASVGAHKLSEVANTDLARVLAALQAVSS